jgi:Restriction endonuclease S subunits
MLQLVGDAFDICNYLRYPISQDIRKKIAGEYPYYGPTKAQDYINEYRVEGEYALIGEDGDHFLKWRESPMTLLVNGKFNVNNHAHLIKGVKNLTSWFYYYFQNKDLTPYLKRQGAGRYKLTKNTLIMIPCPIPPLPEQQAIAAALSDVDALITSLDKLIAKKRAIKQATMQQLLTGKTRLPGFSGVWEIYKLEDIADNNVRWSITGGPFGSNLKTVDYTADGVRIIQLQNIGDGVFYDDYKIYTSEEKADELISCNIYPGEIILSKMGDPVARACIIPNSNVRYLMASDGIRLVVNRKRFDILFVHDYINSVYFRKKAIEASTGSTRQRIGLEDLKKLPIVAPPLPEQQAIATILSDMDVEISALEQKRKKTHMLKQGMMQELLTGRTRLL